MSQEELVSQSTPSLVRSIAEAIVIKDDNLFLTTHRDGTIPSGLDHGFGLYYNDCRYLSGYGIRLGDTKPYTLVSNASREFASVLQLCNEEFTGLDGNPVRKDQLGIKWERIICGKSLRLGETILFQNFGLETAVFEVTLRFAATFEDVFIVRGFMPSQRGELSGPRWDGNELQFLHEGRDRTFRRLWIQFSAVPDTRENTIARYQITLGSQELKQISLTFSVEESQIPEVRRPQSVGPGEMKRLECTLERTVRGWLHHESKVESDSLSLNRAVVRSFRDLRVLESSHDGRTYFAAGIPWFATLFGRDSLITAIQTLAFNPAIAEETLRLLAKYQGTKDDEWRDEAPGKILHELRFGELARAGEIPHTPYYGTVDATPLFLVLLARFCDWTGNLRLFEELRPAVEGALQWIDEHSDLDQDGYLKYARHSKRGLSNQGWKDSWDAIVNGDGTLAVAPISLVEVQGYVYEAKAGMSQLFERIGEVERARALAKEAFLLKKRFNREFWLEDKDCLALALQRDGRPADVVSSNAGHALWSGIVDQDKGKRIAQRLLENDMFSGWGIRSLSQQEKRYNPLGYHVGTVWPHDNSIVAAGFKRYGCNQGVLKLFDGIFRSSVFFENNRLPELFAGFSEKDYGVPVHYPVACHPQAWAAGAIPHFIETLLGLTPNAFSRELRIVRPLLPDFVDKLEFRALRVGDAEVDLGFYRSERRSVAVEVLKLEGPLEIMVEPALAGELRR